VRLKLVVVAASLLMAGLLLAPETWAGVKISGGTLADLTGDDTGSLDGAFSGPGVTWTEAKEGGGHRQKGLMLQANPTTILTESPGEDREWGTEDDGVVHCFDIGLSTEGCEFLELGPLQNEFDSNPCCSPWIDADGSGTTDTFFGNQRDSHRAPIRVNASTAVVLGAGGLNIANSNGAVPTHAMFCEDRSSIQSGSSLSTISQANFRTKIANDVIHVLRGLGAAGATVEDITTLTIPDTFNIDSNATTTSLSMGLCLGTHVADPVRLNGNTIILGQPGLDGYFHDSEACSQESGQLDPDDVIVVIRDLGASATTATVEVHRLNNLGDGVFLSGSPASRAVRVSNKSAVFASGGEDGEFADVDQDNSCGDQSDNDDDGLIVVKGLGPLGTTTIQSFEVLGTLFAGPGGRPTMVNEDPGTVVVIGTGEDLDLDSVDSNDELVNDNDIHVVQGLRVLGDTPSITSFTDFGTLGRPVRLSDAKAVVMDDDAENDEGNQPVRGAKVHVVRGLAAGGTPSVVSLQVPTDLDFEGDLSNQGASHHVVFGQGPDFIRMNDNQALFSISGPFRLFMVSAETQPFFLTVAGGGDDDQLVPKIERVNDTTAVYTSARLGLRMLKIGPDGGLGVTQIAPGHKHPGGVPTRLSDSKAAATANGALLVISNLDTGFPAVMAFEGSESAAPGARPLRLSDTGVAVASPGKDGDREFAANDDDGEDDDALIFITNLP